jgi:predicted glycogen debranching enzyme
VGTFVGERSAAVVAADIVARESARRARFSNPLERAGDAYLVRRGEGKTIIAGYPWFGDWGRDTFIALRGLCLALGRFAEARDILIAWGATLSLGMLPNRFADRADEAPEYNSVDAALWYVLAVGELLASESRVVSPADRASLLSAVVGVIDGYSQGTRYGIRLDADGLLMAGVPGMQLTWMDAKVGDYVVTPRIGKPVEIQALWLNALSVADGLGRGRSAALRRGMEAFEQRFWNESTGCLNDVVDVDHEPRTTDPSIRPNQVFAAGGLPVTILSASRCRSVLDVVERELYTSGGLRSLAPSDPKYKGRYAGGVSERDSAYHQGTVWPWLSGPFIEAWVKSRGSTREAKKEARERFYEPLLSTLETAGLGHLPELTDGDAPHRPRGCFFQAWSVSEAIRVGRDVL